MSYYILPKNNNIINVNPICSCNNINDVKPYISHSLYYYYNQTMDEIKENCLNESELSNNCFNELNAFNELVKIVNPYEFIFSNVPGYKLSVSKLKSKSNVFYDFLEVLSTTNILESFKNQSIKTLHFTPNYNDTIECFKMLRENNTDELDHYDEINENNMNAIKNNKYDFLFVDVDPINFKKYVTNLIECLILILKNQEFGGSCVIKLNHIFHKQVIDILYILSSIYEKVYILKPNTSNIVSFDKYIVCKNFLKNESKPLYYKYNYYKLIVFLKKLEDKNIVSILDLDIPNYFLIKIEDMNIIIGQQQLESLNTILNILKNKNKEEKIETIKKSNIQKSIDWCEKYKIPYNKFSEKINIFLPTNKEFIDI